MTPNERIKLIEDAKNGKVSLLYIAPESLRFKTLYLVQQHLKKLLKILNKNNVLILKLVIGLRVFIQKKKIEKKFCKILLIIILILLLSSFERFQKR